MTDTRTGLDQLHAVAAGQNGVVTVAQAHRAGLSDAEIRTGCRQDGWLPVFRGSYFIGGRGATGEVPRDAVIRAALLTAGSESVAIRETAAELLALPAAPAAAEVHVAVRAEFARHCQAGLVVHQMPVPLRYRTAVRGLACTTLPRTIADVLLAARRFDAVAMVDAVLQAGLLAPPDLTAVRLLLSGRPGCVVARRHLDECDGRAQSPAETRMRLICRDGGVPPEALQYSIWDRHGALLGIADLAWPSRRLACEVDGMAWHSAPPALYHDRRRQNAFVAAGWQTIRFTWADLAHPAYVVSAVRSALRHGRS